MDKWLRPGLKNLLQDSTYSDCRVVVGSEIFNCHKNILGVASEFFNRLFLSSFKEAATDKVDLKDVTPETFKNFLEYIYTYDPKCLDEHDNNMLMDLLECANKWLVPSLTGDGAKLLEKRAESLTSIGQLIPIFGRVYDHIMNDQLTKNISSMIRSICGASVNCDEALLLSPDAFDHFLVTIEGTLPEIDRFNLLNLYVKINGYQVNMDADNASGASEDDAKATNTDVKANEKFSINHNLSKSYVKQLIGRIDFTKMDIEEFYEGPRHSDLITHDMKIEFMYDIILNKLN
ncbi:uncharacterized protein LOC115623139 [Scaptodrosophila lebanonensis]|uniref:Uncharacterized protein LOC115623139 n=1 Tax=Drosophila lebanonensis TaxID=7225 RepID=A0A6J2TAZ7_DROLE|nr:uncharacterized protein LOC115623139 [Scaptodrosophila lebanonensis]